MVETTDPRLPLPLADPPRVDDFGATGQQVRHRLTELVTFSGGEQLAAAILRYCTLARLRAQTRQTPTSAFDGDASAAAHHGIVAATHLWRRGDVIEPLPAGR